MVTRAALLLAALAAICLARRLPAHASVALALALLGAIDVARIWTAGQGGWRWGVDAWLVAQWYGTTAGVVVCELGRGARR